MLDTCGGHAMPYHYHNDLACDYDHTLPSHSPIIGWALDGYGIYGLYEVGWADPMTPLSRSSRYSFAALHPIPSHPIPSRPELA